MILIKNKKDIEEYIKDLKFDIMLYRLEQERLFDVLLNKSYQSETKPLEIIHSEYLTEKAYKKSIEDYHFSTRYSGVSATYPKKFDIDTHDDIVIEIKEQTLYKLLKKYSDGISINHMGWMCPKGEEEYFNTELDSIKKLFGIKFI